MLRAWRNRRGGVGGNYTDRYVADFLGAGTGAAGLRLRALAFTDWVTVRRNSPAPGEPRGQSIGSAGLGVRLAYQRELTLRADWGDVLNAGGQQGKGDSMVHFRIS